MNKEHKILLLGFMGCGKSTIGRALSKKLRWEFIDLDDIIEKAAGISISEIFATKGEKHFRSLESKALQTLLKTPSKQVIALGGGAPCFNDNLKLMKPYHTIYIKCGVGLLCKRLLKGRAHRPLISNMNKSSLTKYISEALKKRRRYYEQANHIVLGFRMPSQITKRIVYLLK